MPKRMFKQQHDLNEQIDALAKIEKAMRKKVEEQIPIFDGMPCAQQVTSTQGELVLKANPAMQELRALFRDYTALVKAQKDLSGSTTSPMSETSLEELQQRFKLVK